MHIEINTFLGRSFVFSLDTNKEIEALLSYVQKSMTNSFYFTLCFMTMTMQ